MPRSSSEPMKKLENGSEYESADLDSNGVITDKEMGTYQKRLEIEDQNSLRDSQRQMAWFALLGMLLYPSMVLIAEFVGLDKAAKIIGDIAPTYYISTAAIVAAFYGKDAFTKGK